MSRLAAESPPASAEPPLPTPPRRVWLRDLVLVGMLAGVAVALFASIYPAKGYVVPLGWDTPRYLWRSACVAEGGLAALPACAPPATSILPSRALPSRVAYPLVFLPLDAALAPSPYATAAVLPPVLAVAVALAAAALVTACLRATTDDFLLVAAIVATSFVVVRMATPEAYADNLIAMAVALAGLAAAALALSWWRGVPVAAGLLAVAALAHWPTFAIVAGSLAILAVAFARRSLRDRRVGVPLWSTPSSRLAAVLGGAIAGWAGLLAAVGALPDRFVEETSELEKKLRQDVRRHSFPLTIPAAAAGAVVVSRRPGGRPLELRRRYLAGLLAAWLAIVAVAIVAWLLGRRIPAHRFLVLALPIPILGALAVAWASGRARVRSPALAAAVVLLGVALLAVPGYRQWWRSRPQMEESNLQVAANAGRYLEREVAAGRPVVVVMEAPLHDAMNTVDRRSHTLRAALPPSRIAGTYAYLGPYDALLARGPAPTGMDDVYDRVTRSLWRTIEPIWGDDPPVLMLAGYTPEFDELAAEMGDRVVAPGVLALRGPLPDAPLGPAPPQNTTIGGWWLVGLAGVTFAALWLAGAGWAFAMLRGRLRPFEIAAVAPAFGLAALVVTGLAADRLGVRLSGAGGVAALAVATGAGVLAAALAVRSRSPAGPEHAEGEGGP